MNKKKKTILRSLILYSLRFHHQDLHEEIESLKFEMGEIKKLLTKLIEKNYDVNCESTPNIKS